MTVEVMAIGTGRGIKELEGQMRTAMIFGETEQPDLSDWAQPIGIYLSTSNFNMSALSIGQFGPVCCVRFGHIDESVDLTFDWYRGNSSASDRQLLFSYTAYLDSPGYGNYYVSWGCYSYIMYNGLTNGEYSCDITINTIGWDSRDFTVTGIPAPPEPPLPEPGTFVVGDRVIINNAQFLGMYAIVTSVENPYMPMVRLETDGSLWQIRANEMSLIERSVLPAFSQLQIDSTTVEQS